MTAYKQLFDFMEYVWSFYGEHDETLYPIKGLTKKDIYDACKAVINHEDAFIDLAFELGGVQGLEAKQVKDYIRYIADLRLTQLGMEKLFHIKEHPLPWMVEMLGSWDETFKQAFGT